MCRLYNNHFPILQSLLIRAQCTGIDKSHSKGLQVTSTSKTHIKSHEDDLKIHDEVLDNIKFKSIKIVDEKFLIECSSMKLPCGHGIAPHSKSLSEYCIKQVSKGNTEIKCLVCDKKLELSMLKSMLLTEKQMYKIEMGLTRNYFLSDPEKHKECPQCGLFIENTGTRIKMKCPICKEMFCWKCKTNWNATSHKDCATTKCDVKH